MQNHPIDLGKLLRHATGHTLIRAPYATLPKSVYIVVAVSTGNATATLRSPWDVAGNGFTYRYLSAVVPAVGNRVLVDNLNSGPIISHVL